jgi:hypothetical protein
LKDLQGRGGKKLKLNFIFSLFVHIVKLKYLSGEQNKNKKIFVHVLPALAYHT